MKSLTNGSNCKSIKRKKPPELYTWGIYCGPDGNEPVPNYVGDDRAAF